MSEPERPNSPMNDVFTMETGKGQLDEVSAHAHDVSSKTCSSNIAGEDSKTRILHWPPSGRKYGEQETTTKFGRPAASYKIMLRSIFTFDPPTFVSIEFNLLKSVFGPANNSNGCPWRSIGLCPRISSKLLSTSDIRPSFDTRKCAIAIHQPF